MVKFAENNCIKCSYPLSDNVYNYSIKHIQYGLCQNCQDWFRTESNKPTWETKRLFLALKARNVPVEIEKFDGHKTIDLAIPNLKINIEVDGSQHNYDKKQAISDLLRTLHSFKKGYLTFRIPNILAKQHLDETADYITSIVLSQKEMLSNNKMKKSILDEKEKLEKMVIEFMVYFFTVFESDWEYTNFYISQEGENHSNLLTDFPNDANWLNRDLMINAYQKLHDFLSKKGIFQKHFSDRNDMNVYDVMFQQRYDIQSEK